MRRVASSCTVVLCLVTGVRAATAPPGFEEHLLVDPSASDGAAAPVGIAYEPGTGALFVLEKGDGTAAGTARVRRRDAAAGGVTTALTIGCVDSVGERGLLGIVEELYDGRFPFNRWQRRPRRSGRLR